MTITRLLLLLVLFFSSIAVASQGATTAPEIALTKPSSSVGAEPCAVTLRGQVKDPVGCTLHLANQSH